jgi:hypothetical protein
MCKVRSGVLWNVAWVLWNVAWVLLSLVRSGLAGCPCSPPHLEVFPLLSETVVTLGVSTE